MEITGKGPGASIEAYMSSIKGKGPAAPAQKTASVPALQEDKVILSPEAKEILDAKRQIEDVPDIRTEKVDALRQQVESGTYEVQGDRVAVKMIGESLINQLL